MSAFNKTTCRACGREFSPPVVGETTDLCADCRQKELPDQQPRAQKPPLSALIQAFPVTGSLIVLNIAVYVLMVAKGVSPTDPNTEQLLRWGANFGPKTLGAEWWRALSSCFVHAGIIHLAFNMWCLWSLGIFVERYLGRVTFAIAYVLAGLGGAVCSVWWHPLGVGVGASGAIFGAAGMLVTLLRSGQLQMPAEYLKHHSKSILIFIGYNLFFGFINPHIDNAAHLGGLATGLLLGALLPVHGSEDGGSRKLAAFGVAAVLIFSGYTYAKRTNAAPIAWVQGVQAAEAKQYDKAEGALREAIRHDPKFANAYIDLGYVLLMEKKYGEAVPVLQTATQLVPNQSISFTNLGYAYVKMDRPQDAEVPLKRAVQIDPKDADAWENLAMAYAASRKRAEARDAASNALRLNPKLEEAPKILDALGQPEAPEATPKK